MVKSKPICGRKREKANPFEMSVSSIFLGNSSNSLSLPKCTRLQSVMFSTFQTYRRTVPLSVCLRENCSVMYTRRLYRKINYKCRFIFLSIITKISPLAYGATQTRTAGVISNSRNYRSNAERAQYSKRPLGHIYIEHYYMLLFGNFLLFLANEL